MFGKLLLPILCALLMNLAVACHQAPAPVPLQDNPQYPTQTNADEHDDLYYEAGHMTAEQAAALEQELKGNPDDFVARRKLLIFYGPDFASNLMARRRHILWLIGHHPDDPLAGSWEARIFPKSPDPAPDPIGYAQAKKLWIKQTANPNAGVGVLSNAASFLEVTDKPLAEELLLRGQAKAPYADWSTSLGQLYAAAVLGSIASIRTGTVQSVASEEAHSAYALNVREKLSTSTDDKLLTAAGTFMVSSVPPGGGLNFDPVALGKSYLHRALDLNPQSTEARASLVEIVRSERIQRIRDMLTGVPKESEYQVVASRPEAERFLDLPWLIQAAWGEAQSAGDRGQKNTMTSAWERTHKYADDLLSLAPRFKNSPEYGTAFYIANVGLSAIAMHEGKVKKAVEYLREAVKAPPSDELAYSGDLITYSLLTRLLKAGERDSVVRFLERLADVKVVQRRELLDALLAIHNGKAPLWYQSLLG